ncbi:MAG: hypothetical protein K8L99_16125 [Anaerolineae bacterium]|nr:hypothetical protein [Anaerolineae bacterium]
MLLRAGPDLWIVLDNCPTQLTPDRLWQLYELLRQHIIPDVTHQLRPPLSAIPAVLRFVKMTNSAQFPKGTSNFSGLTGLASWTCYHESEVARFCIFADADIDEPIRLALVQNDNTTKTLGTAIHEMAHLLGAVDGPHCLMYEANCTENQLVSDPSDAYWWYSSTSIYHTETNSLVNEALNCECAASDHSALCEQLADLLEPDCLLNE